MFEIQVCGIGQDVVLSIPTSSTSNYFTSLVVDGLMYYQVD